MDIVDYPPQMAYRSTKHVEGTKQFSDYARSRIEKGKPRIKEMEQL